ncbi:MAG: hypothetical protein Q4Q06_02625 [Bacteroidota bacterium]|nr:hypothetical protein [Bacteroidota bacterium]
MKTIKIFFTSLCLIFCFTSCFKDAEEEEYRQYDGEDYGLYVLCEGTGADNNSALSYYSFKDSLSILDYFKEGLGKNANDMIKVGEELYIVVTESACVWVLDKNTGSQIARIEITDEQGNNRKPRHLTYYDGYIYVSCWDASVVKISKKTHLITEICSTLGRYPEGIAIANNKIYVANSGGLDYPNYDKTVSVIDVNSFSFEKKIEVGENPQTLKAYKNKIYVLSTGNYMVTPTLTVINNSEVEKQISMNIADFDFWENKMYFFYTSPYADPTSNKDFNFSYLDINNLDEPAKVLREQTLSGMVMPYHISIIGNTIFISDAKNFNSAGEVFALDTLGNLRYKFPTLINPSKVVQK